MPEELLEKVIKIESKPKQEHKGRWKEIEQKKVTEELKKYEEKNSEYYEECKKAGYRELEKEEISKKSCWSCSHSRGGCIGMGFWCSQEKCDYKENENVLIPQ